MLRKLSFVLALLIFVPFSRAQTYNAVNTISVSTVDVDITAGMIASNVVVRENSDAPTAVFYITLAGQSVAQKYSAGTKFKFVAPGNHPFTASAVIGKIHASTTGPFSFTVNASAAEPSESMASTGGGSSGTSLSINGSTVSNPNLNASSPSPDSGFTACTWVVSSSNAICEMAVVPPSRTVNGHALSSNVSVTASDVGLGSVTNDAQTKAAIVPNTVPTAAQLHVGNAGGTAFGVVSLTGDCTITFAGVMTCSGFVPTSRTVAGKALSSNITIACGDLSNAGTGCSANPVTSLSGDGDLFDNSSSTGGVTLNKKTAGPNLVYRTASLTTTSPSIHSWGSGHSSSGPGPTATFSPSILAGSCLIGFGWFNLGTASAGTVTDSSGNWTFLASDGGGFGIFYKSNSTAGVNAISMSGGGGNHNPDILVVAEVTNAATTSCAEVANTATGTSTSPSVTSGSVTGTDFILGGVIVEGGSVSFSNFTNATQITSDAAGFGYSEAGYYLNTPKASGTATISGTISGSQTWIAGIVGVKALANYTPSMQANTNTCANITDAAASCATDATNASNIGTGTLAAARVATLNQSTSGNAATATALAANGTNCSSGNYPLGVDASGNSEGCSAVPADATNAANISSGTLSPNRLPGSVNGQIGTTYTVVDGDNQKLINFTGQTASVAVTLPQANSGAQPFQSIFDSATNALSISSNSGTTASISLTAGRAVIFVGEWNSTGPTATTLTTSKSDSCSLLGSGNNQVGSTTPHWASFLCYNVVGGSTTFTLTFVSGPGAVTYHIAQYSNILTSNAVDGTVVAASGNGTLPNSGNVTTTTGPDLLIAIMPALSCSPAISTAAGWNLRTGSMMFNGFIADQVQNSSGTYNAVANQACSANWGAQLIALKTTGLTPTFTAGWKTCFADNNQNNVVITPTTSTIGNAASSLTITPGKQACVISDGTKYPLESTSDLFSYTSDRTGQTSAISDVTMLTVGSADTVYRFTGMIDCTGVTSGASATLNLKYTSTSNTAQTASVTDSCTALITTGIPNLVAGIRAKASTTIKFGVTIVGSPTFDASVRLEAQ